MSYGFAAEFTFEKEGGDIRYIDGKLVCDHWAVSDTTEIEKEVFNPIVAEDSRVKGLENGYYHCYVEGQVEFDTAEGTWNRDTEYIFIAEETNVAFHRLGNGEQNGE